MIDKSQIVHDLAVVYAEQKFREFIEETSARSRMYPQDASELFGFYAAAVANFINRGDEIEAAYLDDDGLPILDFE